MSEREKETAERGRQRKKEKKTEGKKRERKCGISEKLDKIDGRK